MCQVHLETHH